MSTPECAPPSGARGSATHVRVLGFRNLADQEVELGTGLTLLWGANGAGKTNLLEAVCVGLTGQSCRTRNDREMVAFEERLGRVEVDLADGTERRRLLWSFGRDGDRRHLIDDKPAPADQSGIRPPVAIFIPDRLALLKGPPAGRRGHLDALLGALWPARAELRRAYGRALAQRNALLGRIRGGSAPRDSLDAWDLELARAGVELVAARAEAVGALASEFASAGAELGLRGEPELRYRPRSDASDASELASELSSRRDADLGRGHTTHGPHLDEVEISLGARSARRYASQGEQRAAVLALLFAERRALLDARGAPPLMLLDDVMSELDPDRRALLAARLAEGGGQALLTATERDQLPADCERLELQMSAGIPARPSIRRASTPPLGATAPLAA